jgi:hypothetical protein
MLTLSKDFVSIAISLSLSTILFMLMLALSIWLTRREDELVRKYKLPFSSARANLQRRTSKTFNGGVGCSKE